jgi:hypothetical protein
MAFLLDDDWDNDPRVIRAGTAAFGLYSRCGMWVARHLTDGFVPAEQAASYGTREWVAKLVEAGLWKTVEGGYQMVDYLALNPSAEKVRRRREQYAARQKRWRDSQGRKRDSNASRDASGNASPSPPLKGRGRAPASQGAARAPDNPDWRSLPALGHLDPDQQALNAQRVAELRAAINGAQVAHVQPTDRDKP